jgi:hypothetical protein
MNRIFVGLWSSQKTLSKIEKNKSLILAILRKWSYNRKNIFLFDNTIKSFHRENHVFR